MRLPRCFYPVRRRYIRRRLFYSLSGIFILTLLYNYNLTRINETTKTILVWNSSDLIFAGNANRYEFIKCKCKVYNCAFTTNKDLLGDYTKFDAIFFRENDLNLYNKPTRRSEHQIYIFGSLESSYNYAACELSNDNFFNWTFTYRLDSDILWNYIFVRDLKGRIVAPSKNVRWEYTSLPLKPRIKAITATKAKKARAVVWLVSNCESDRIRDTYLSRLKNDLCYLSLEIDVFGSCNNMTCDSYCLYSLSQEYFFYLAFENSIVEDYITEKVLHGYSNYLVPIVYGGANYSRFLPPGSYINARDYSPYNLAYLIYEAVTNREIYEEYFTWTNAYTIESAETRSSDHPFCNLCAALHSDRALLAPVYKQFRHWWNGLNGKKWCLNEYFSERALVNVGGIHLVNMDERDTYHLCFIG